jgi:hypothetical protein
MALHSAVYPYGLNKKGNIGPQASKFISYINDISGVDAVDAATGVRKQ